MGSPRGAESCSVSAEFRGGDPFCSSRSILMVHDEELGGGQRSEVQALEERIARWLESNVPAIRGCGRAGGMEC